MFRGITQQLSAARGEGGGFGSVAELGLPLAEVPLSNEISVTEVQMTGQPRVQDNDTLVAVALGRLTRLKPENKKLQERLSEIIDRAVNILAVADAIVDECTAEKQTKLEKRHEEIVSKGRTLQAQLPVFEKALAAAQHDWNTKRELKARCRNALIELTNRRKNISRWSTKEQIAAADEAIARAKESAREVQAIEQAAMREYAKCESELATAQRQLEVLATEEGRLKAEMSGLPYFDPYTGLSTVPVSRTS